MAGETCGTSEGDPEGCQARDHAKLKAGEWALEQQLCPVPETLKKVLLVRREPLKYKDAPEFKAWAGSLGNDVQRFADVLEQELGKTGR